MAVVVNDKCPVEPAHGKVVSVTGSPRWGWRCPHQAHDGQSSRNPEKHRRPTRSFFTTAEVMAGRLDP